MTDREKVIRAVETCFDSWIDKHRYKGLNLHEVERVKHDALELLKAQPDVVRCKNCKFWHDPISCQMYSEGMETGEDWFCADGERR